MPWLDLEEGVLEEFAERQIAVDASALAYRISRDKGDAPIGMRVVDTGRTYEAIRAYMKSVERPRRRLSGKCRYCSRPARTRRCGVCAEKNRIYARSYMAKRYAEGANVGSRRQRKAAA